MNSNKYNNIETNIIRVLNIIKIAALVGIIVLFILQKTTDAAGQALWVKTALIIVAGVGFSAMISGSLLKKEGNPLKMFIIFLVIIIAFGVLIFLLSLQDTGYITIDKNSLNLLYILLGVLFVILLVVYLLKVFVINKLENNDLEKREEVKIINNFTEDEEDKT